MNKSNAKINNSCLNIFKLIVLLYEDNAYYDNVVSIFKSDIEKESDYKNRKKQNNLTQVVLNKYINALRIFGIKIHKDKNKFKLDNSLYSIKYTLPELKALSLLIGGCSAIEDEEIVSNISKLKSDLLLRMNSEDKNTLDLYNNEQDLSFFYEDIKKQIEKCKSYAQSDVMLDITYLYRNKERRCKCKAKEVVYSVKTACLKVYDVIKNDMLTIPIPNILSISQVKNKTLSYIKSQTVVFKLKGRLASTYKLKINEKLDSKTKDEIVVINRDEPTDILLPRLMRYSNCCEVISPKYLRTEMSDLINATLNLYEQK